MGTLNLPAVRNAGGESQTAAVAVAVVSWDYSDRSKLLAMYRARLHAGRLRNAR